MEIPIDYVEAAERREVMTYSGCDVCGDAVPPARKHSGTCSARCSVVAKMCNTNLWTRLARPMEFA